MTTQIREEEQLSSIRLLLEFEGRDQNGLLVAHSMQEVNSWVKQGAQLFRHAMVHEQDELNVRDVNNVLHDLRGGNNNFKMKLRSDAGDLTRGLIAGTGQTPVSKDDFDVETRILEGSGPGQLNYQATLIGAPIQVTGGYRLTVQRQVINNSGASITIYEVGAVAEGIALDSPFFFPFLMVRDLVNPPAGYVLPATNNVTMRYHFDCLV